MSEYVCIAMLEDPPFSIILATTNDPTDWLNELPLPSHLILCESVPDARKFKQKLIKSLKEVDIAARSNKAFSAHIHEVINTFLRVRDEVLFGESSDQISDDAIEDTDCTGSDAKPHSTDKDKSEGDKYFELAEQYYNGNGVELDREKAKEFYLKAALNYYHAEAQYRMGFICLISKDYHQSELMFRVAAEQGHIQALSHMVYSSDTYDQSDKWYNEIRKAAEKGNADAQYQLGEDYQLGYSNYDNFTIDKDEELASFWYLKAAKSYQKLAEQGDSVAQTKLARMYSSGEGVESDDEESVYWYRLAADQGNPDALWGMGNEYRKGGFGVVRDYKEAVRYFHQAAEKGCSSSQFDLFIMYSGGFGVEEDFHQAAIWCHKAADRGHDVAKIHLADLYLEGRGVERNEKLSDYWLSQTVKNLPQYRLRDLAKLWSKRHNQIPLSPALIFKLAQWYSSGDILPQDDDTATNYYRKAAARGYAPAQCYLASMYLNGNHVEQSDQKAFAWFKKAAELNDASGQYNLAVMCFKGRGIDQDKELAIFWCKKAAIQGHQAAQEALMKIGIDWI